MPGYTPAFQLPYLLKTEALHRVSDTTEQLADRLDTLITAGDLTGATGPANSLAIGTVSTAPAGSPAAANIAGSAPNQTLSLTLPQGTGLELADVVPTVGDLPAAGAAGTAILVNSAPPHLWVSDGSTWVDAGPLQGPQGEPAPNQVTGADLTLAVSATPPAAGTPATTITVVS